MLDVDFCESRFLQSNTLFFEKILDKISHLYYYTMTYTGQKRHSTSTFDYSKFRSYINYIAYVTYRVSEDSNLRQYDNVKEFIKHYEKLMTDDYSGDAWHTERQMQEQLKEINKKYSIVELDKE